MMGGMSAAFGSRRDTSDAARAAPLRGVSAAAAGTTMVTKPLFPVERLTMQLPKGLGQDTWLSVSYPPPAIQQCAGCFRSTSRPGFTRQMVDVHEICRELHVLQEPVTDFRQRVAECNACIPYSGVAGNARVEDSALTAILSLLPVDPPAGANPPPPSTKDAIRTINILHCLQRLVTSASVATALLQTPGLLLSTFSELVPKT